MLTRGFYDALSLWPVVAWPLIFSSLFFAFLRLCQLHRQRHGFSLLNGRRGTDLLARWLFVPVAALFEGAVHLYLLWTIGYAYVAVAVPIYMLGWIVLPALLDDFAPAMLLLPLGYLGVGASFVVLLGFADVAPLRAFNAELYSVLTGLPVAL